MSMPSIPPIWMMAAAIIVAALALFFLPALLGFGDNDRTGGPAASASPGVSAAPSASAEPTPTPGPTPQLYIVQSGDTMSSIASRFNVTLDALIAANRDTVPNPDRLDVGDELIIPVPGSQPVFPSGEPSAEASPSP
jgi:LysM repeat protein